MPRVSGVQFRGAIVFTPVFECFYCHGKALGDRCHIHLDEAFVQDVIDRITTLDVSAQSMPIGWAHGDVYVCRACRDKGEVSIRRMVHA